MVVSPQSTRRTSLGKSIVSAVVFVVSLAGHGIATAATAEQMYTAALEREEKLRPALAAPDAPGSVAADARAVIAAYQNVVRSYPTSGYSDNALWQAGCLSIDLFVRFGEARDKATGLRLLKLLQSEYPSSSLLKEVAPQLTRAETVAPRNIQPEASTQKALKISTIKQIRREVLPDAVRVTIELDSEVSFRDERIPNPVRVFVDLPSTRLAPALAEKTFRFDGDRALVRQIRIGRHPNNVTRIVLEADGVSSYSVYPLYNPYRLVIDSFKDTPAPPIHFVQAPTPPAPVETPARADTAAAPLVSASMDLPTGVVPAVLTAKAELTPPATTPAAAPPAAALPEPNVTAETAEAPVSAPPPADKLPAPSATTAPARNAGGGYSMARQLGLKVSRIVIDPGHGGHDPGAKGKSIEESELVLDIALRVEKLLESVPEIEVILTRRTDTYVALQERTAIANREGADLFLSIHANASPNTSAHGVETYFLNFASNMSAAAVAARENAASGQAMGALPDFLKQIALNNKLAESRDFATAVQAAMVERLRRTNKSLKDLGVKQAPFVVLIGAAMPSVLAEISFVTNAQEARLLRGSAYRQRIAEALVHAIRKYQTSLKGVRVAQQ
jgi:N-acetylmuramoyl-L-alanine amidase